MSRTRTYPEVLSICPIPIIIRVAAAFSSYDGDLRLPLGLALEAQSSPRVARES